MEETEKILYDIGFKKNEAKVYLSLVKLGESTACKIADVSKIYRANVYEALENLIKKGVVTYIIKKNVKHFYATDPENLINDFKSKEAKLKHIIPQLKINHTLAEKKGEAHVYEGIKPFFDIYYGFLRFNEPILVWGIPKIAIPKFKYMIDNYHRERIKKKIVKKHIYNSDATERINFVNSMEYTEARTLPPEFDSQVETAVCGDEVIIVDWNDPVTVILIKNKNLANSYKKYFEILYDKAIPGKKVKKVKL
ncbi:TrmB family transcriptional regulator [Nanoarchaeota archaeon]